MEDETLIFDITSLSSASRNIDWREWGYNRLIDIECALQGKEVEKKFDELKNELDIMPLRVQKIETLHGLLFIFFISLILRALLLRR